jgi:hypothetical protein
MKSTNDEKIEAIVISISQIQSELLMRGSGYLSSNVMLVNVPRNSQVIPEQRKFISYQLSRLGVRLSMVGAELGERPLVEPINIGKPR